MELKLTSKGPKLGKRAIDNLKNKLALELPSDYVDFLSTYNGGTSDGYWFRSKRAKRYVNTFLAIKSSPRGPMTIDRVLQNCRERIPNHVVPIAFVDGENLLLLRVDARKFGQIDLYVDCDSDSPSKGIHRVAKTFGEFLKGLQFTDPAELDDDDYGLW